MRKLFIQTLFIMLCCMGTLPVAAQSMSDTQVLEYVKQGLKEGKDQRVLATELARKGVTEEQARRVKELYDKQTIRQQTIFREQPRPKPVCGNR